MKNLILSPLKGFFGDEYAVVRARAFAVRDIWRERSKNIWRRLFYAKPFRIERNDLENLKQVNRQTLGSISGWYDQPLFARSVCNYGISPEKLNLLDAAIGSETTLSDIISYYFTTLQPPARYLEIGVSVGKNFVQIVKVATRGDFTGFDIEDAGPIITRDLIHQSREEWSAFPPSDGHGPAAVGFSRSSASSLDIFKNREDTKTIRYVAGDVFDERCWQILSRNKYDMIFSDAMHTGPAIKHEYEMIKKYHLLGDKDVTIIWDDLHFPGMREAFTDITDDLLKTYRGFDASRSLHLAYGWAGRNEGFRHLVGIFRARP